jgi:hypothetical protein
VKFCRSTTISPGKRPSLSHPIQGHNRPPAPRLAQGCLPETERRSFLPRHNGQGLAPPDAFRRTSPIFAAVKGIFNAPCTEPAMRPENRDALLDATAKARGWIVRPPPQPDRCEVFKEFEPWERYALMPTKSAFSGATRQGHRLWCAGASRRWFGLASARPKRQSQPGNLVNGGMLGQRI